MTRSFIHALLNGNGHTGGGDTTTFHHYDENHDSNPPAMLLCSGWLFKRGIEEDEIQVCVCASQMMSSVKAPCHIVIHNNIFTPGKACLYKKWQACVCVCVQHAHVQYPRVCGGNPRLISTLPSGIHSIPKGRESNLGGQRWYDGGTERQRWDNSEMTCWRGRKRGKMECDRHFAAEGNGMKRYTGLRLEWRKTH